MTHRGGGYIKNRPCYVSDELVNGDIIVEETVEGFVQNAIFPSQYYADLTSTVLLEEDKLYTVIFDGVEYSNLTCAYGNNEYPGIGASDSTEFAEYPFVIMDQGGYLICYTNSIESSHSIVIYDVKNKVVQLDEKYIPDKYKDSLTMVVTLSQTVIMPTMGEAGPEYQYITDKTFEEISAHIEKGGSVVLYDTTGNSFTEFRLLMYIPGELLYFVAFNITGGEITVLGGKLNLGGIGQGIVQITPNNRVMRGLVTFDVGNTDISYLETNSKTIVGAINEVNSKSTMLVTATKTDDDWSIDKTYNEIKAHIVGGGTAVLYDSLKGRCMNFCGSEGSKIIFSLIDVVSRYHTTTYGLYGDNPLTNVPELSQISFDIHADGSIVYENRCVSVADAVISGLKTTNKTVVSAINEVYDNSSIQSDWNQNDETAIDYMKNRTHYVVYDDLAIDNQTIPATVLEDFLAYDITLIKPLVADSVCIVIDGVKYENVPYFDPNATATLGGVGILAYFYGDFGASDGSFVFNEFPFLFAVQMENSDDGYKHAKAMLIFEDSNTDEHTVSLYLPTIHQLNEKYIPSTIARTEALNDLEEKVDSARNEFGIIDEDNGYTYIVRMQSGQLVTFCSCASISMHTPPTNLDWTVDGPIDTTGMVVVANCQDGTERDITKYVTCSDMDATNQRFTISYTELGVKYTQTINSL